jgi:hypothetical protein
MGSPYGGELVDPRLPRKASHEEGRYPYRKPTQVGRMNILRRASDPPLRNSAI